MHFSIARKTAGVRKKFFPPYWNWDNVNGSVGVLARFPMFAPNIITNHVADHHLEDASAIHDLFLSCFV
jgi:hypothetical protein